MAVTIEEVKKIASLVKIDISGEEEKMAKMLDQTLEFIKVLDELDTSNVEPTYQVTGLENVWQAENHPKNTLDADAALKNAKTKSQNLFETKGVFDR